MYNSDFSGSLQRQSASLDANPKEDNGFFLTASLALRAAILARDAKIHFSIINLLSAGCSAK